MVTGMEQIATGNGNGTTAYNVSNTGNSLSVTPLTKTCSSQLLPAGGTWWLCPSEFQP